MTRPSRRGLGRWSVLAGAGAVLALLATVGVLVALRHGPESRPGPPSAGAAPLSAVRASPGPSLVPAADWQVTVRPGTRIEGFADRTSVLPGGPVRLRVSGTGRSFSVTAFRIGDYSSTPAATAWHGGPFPLVAQPPQTVLSSTRTVVAGWRPTATVPTDGWPPGAYLLRLRSDDGAQGYVPLTVRSASGAGRVVLVQAVTTWQAYNDWGGSSLYHGPDGLYASRSYAVTFDRPYAEEAGAGDFLGNELPLIAFAEHLGIPTAYATDVDLHEDPHLLDGARAVVSPGHATSTSRPPCGRR
jgi:hypothetical protein